MRTIFISLLTLALAGGCTLFVDFEPQNKKETNCRDGVDNDNDGYTDCEDPECWTNSNCTGEVCDNGLDDDDDKFWDCEDPECWDDPNCGLEGEICDNGVDDEGDVMVDCDDPECYFHPNCTTNWEDCENSVDDDGDGQVDCEDLDCADSFHCRPHEICTNGDDDDDDTLVDCDDDECFGIDGCNQPGGEYDCGNAWDDDMDGMIDCLDPDCDDIILCQNPPLSPCTAFVPFTASPSNVTYYRDIYQSAMTTNCGNNSYCGIRPDVSLIPHCYPLDTANQATHYQPCSTKLCGPGLVCLSPGPMEPELCLPLCAPGHNIQCIGGDGVCFRYWMTNRDNHISRDVELWTCGRPACDPMNLMNNGCNPPSAACYPSTDLFGDAVCIAQPGTSPPFGICSSDHDCTPGHICRMDENEGQYICRKLCKDLADCTTSPGTGCRRDDSRQLFGYCR